MLLYWPQISEERRGKMGRSRNAVMADVCEHHLHLRCFCMMPQPPNAVLFQCSDVHHNITPRAASAQFRSATRHPLRHMQSGRTTRGWYSVTRLNNDWIVSNSLCVSGSAKHVETNAKISSKYLMRIFEIEWSLKDVGEYFQSIWNCRDLNILQ